MPVAPVNPGAGFNSAALTSELNTDPLGLGYAAVLANSDDLALKINAIPEPIAVANQEQIWKKTVPARELVACIIAADYTALTQTQRDLCALVFGTPDVLTGDANLRTLVISIFAAGTTRTNLTNAASRLASRAEVLFGGPVTAQQVAAALGR
jgi:hypothetical protein